MMTKWRVKKSRYRIDHAAPWKAISPSGQAISPSGQAIYYRTWRQSLEHANYNTKWSQHINAH